ncbi:hypothetical protein PCH_Pc17g00240 [Penicillium rubens Wisconsin 54-1255]|uniref:Uncharacterized protein n=1 Tax=Penicillium rubens (strain ATCC 28089 / DSM 1075 / NRRL 1951 / Wisconsin 54-1255) TaxID=500485 RepID=B6HAV6_PENRW|nr:hypothetical protein PCH_Pc17g00240 [Penicillium rubens Wisconsin 54-1255]
MPRRGVLRQQDYRRIGLRDQYASQGGAAKTRLPRRIGLRDQYASQGGAAKTRLPRRGALRYQVNSARGRCDDNSLQETAALPSSLQETAALTSSLQETAALPSSPQLGPASKKRLAGTSATTRASSTCRHLFVVLGTSIRVFQEYSEKQRPAQHLHRLFIVPKGHHWIHRRSPSQRSLPIQQPKS